MRACYDDLFAAPPKGALDLTRAKRVLGYQPEYDLHRGLASHIEWYRRG